MHIMCKILCKFLPFFGIVLLLPPVRGLLDTHRFARTNQLSASLVIVHERSAGFIRHAISGRSI
jgi:hypothetical protein